jgi:NDP-sugar pyrophosphorylase family protein
MDHFGDGSGFGVSITYSYEPELLGTAGAVKKLRSFFGDTFLVIYGDNLIDCDLDRLRSFHLEHQGMGTIALHYREDVSQSGVAAVDADGRVTHFIEKPQTDRAISHWVSAGVLVLETEVFEDIPSGIPSDFGREILPALLQKGKRLYGYRLKESEKIWWIDRMEDLDLVQDTFKQIIKKE